MGREDWFRNREWSQETARHFEEKLGRARAQNRAQYLRVQGATLIYGETPEAKEAGEVLLRRSIEEYPEDLLQASLARATLADALHRHGRLREAEDVYRSLFEMEAPAIRPHIRYAELLIDLDDPSADEKALRQLDLGSPHAFLLAERFACKVGYARIHERAGREQIARSHAEKALEIARSPQPQLPRHKDIILEPPQGVIDEMESLLHGDHR